MRDVAPRRSKSFIHNDSAVFTILLMRFCVGNITFFAFSLIVLESLALRNISNIKLVRRKRTSIFFRREPGSTNHLWPLRTLFYRTRRYLIMSAFKCGDYYRLLLWKEYQCLGSHKFLFNIPYLTTLRTSFLIAVLYSIGIRLPTRF